MKKSTRIVGLCCILIVIAAVPQFVNPQWTYFDAGYIVAILLTGFLMKDGYTWLLGGVGITLIVLSALYSENDQHHLQVLYAHGFALIIAVMATLVTANVKDFHRSLEADQQQVTALFEHATEGIILTDDKGKIVLLNPAAVQLFEYNREELLGQPIEILIPSRFGREHTGYRKGFYHTPGNRAMGHGRDLFARKKDSSEFPVEVSLSYYTQKGSMFVIAFIVDITARKQSEKDLLEQKAQLQKITDDIRRLNAELEGKVEERTLILREALQELEQSQKELHEALDKERELSEIKSRFVSMASHEFRTPLSTVLSSAALLSKYTAGDQQALRDRHILKIKDSVKHLNNLLEDFLSLGRLEEGKVTVEHASFEVKEFLDEIVEEMRSLAKDGQSIHCDFTGGNCFVSDKRLLKNILINLLGNAVKFSPAEGSIWLKVSHDAGWLQLSVRDQGIGISQEDQQHLFSSFFRGGNALNIEGTGLGLHIVNRYVELLGGSIRVESALEHGTTINVSLPNLSDSNTFSHA